MAIEKLLNTRIQLKYDTLANWNSSSVILKTGELAIVTLGTNKDGSAAGAANQHPVLFKVGNNEKTFKDLPFASALAADVYSWAKAENVQLSGKTIQFVNGDTVVKSIVLDYITEAEVKEILKGYYTKNEIDNLLAGVKTAYEAYADQAEADAKAYADGHLATAKTYAEAEADAAEAAAKSHSDANLATAKEYADAAVLVEKNRAEGIESGFATRIGNLETAIGENGSVATQISNAIAGLDSSASHTAGADGLALSVELVDGKVTSIAGSIAAETYDEFGAAAAAQSAAEGKAAELVSGLENGQVKLNKEAIAAIKNGASVNDFAAAEAAIADAKKAGTDANAALETYKGLNDAAVALKAAQADLEAEIDRATKAEQANAAAIALLVDSTEGDDTKLNSIKELATWIEEHGGDAAEMAEAIDANAGAIAQEIKDREAAVQGVQDQIDALGIEDGKVESAAMADKADSLTDNAKAEVKAVKVDNATNADEAAHAANADNAADAAKLGGVAAADYALKTDAQGYANKALEDAQKYADQAELDAIAAAKTYTDGRETAIKAAYEAYADQAEADAKAYTDAREVEIKKYADQAEADAIAAAATDAKSKADQALADAKAYADQAELDAIASANAYADGLAGNYATAAQGAKADSALQEVEVGTGLKVSAKADNKQKIEIDTDVVFVFNCGSASVLVD